MNKQGVFKKPGFELNGFIYSNLIKFFEVIWPNFDQKNQISGLKKPSQCIHSLASKNYEQGRMRKKKRRGLSFSAPLLPSAPQEMYIMCMGYEAMPRGTEEWGGGEGLGKRRRRH